jgi:hypothetical protein
VPSDNYLKGGFALEVCTILLRLPVSLDERVPDRLQSIFREPILQQYIVAPKHNGLAIIILEPAQINDVVTLALILVERRLDTIRPDQLKLTLPHRFPDEQALFLNQ